MKSGNYSYQRLSILVQQLKLLCQEKQSGRLFIITDSQKLSHISLRDGIIINISFAAYKDIKALALLSKVRRCRFHFTRESRQKSVNNTVLKGSNDKIFKILEANSPQQKVAHKAKVLIADDSEMIRKQVRKALTPVYEVTEASNGLEAIASLAKNKPDLILLDIIMPIMDGYDTLKIIKKNEIYAQIPIFMLTSRDSLFDRLKGKMSKSDKYLTKPFNPETLLETINQHLKDVRSPNLMKRKEKSS